MHIVAFSAGTSSSESSARFALLILKELEQIGYTTELILVGAQPPQHCLDCSSCYTTGICIHDTSSNIWKQKIENADAFIITGYVRNSGLCSTMVTFLEKIYQLSKNNQNFLAGKFGSLGITGDREGGMKAIFDIVSFFQNSNATLVWPCYWPFTWNIGTGGNFEDNDAEGVNLALDIARQLSSCLGIDPS